MKNPTTRFNQAWRFVKGLIDSQGHMWPRHQGKLDVTEVIEFGEIAGNYGLSNYQHNELIDRAQGYFDVKFSGNPGAAYHRAEKREAVREAAKHGSPIYREFHRGRVRAHSESVVDSEKRLMYNPSKKRRKSKKKGMTAMLVVGGALLALFLLHEV